MQQFPGRCRGLSRAEVRRDGGRSFRPGTRRSGGRDRDRTAQRARPPRQSRSPSPAPRSGPGRVYTWEVSLPLPAAAVSEAPADRPDRRPDVPGRDREGQPLADDAGRGHRQLVEHGPGAVVAGALDHERPARRSGPRPRRRRRRDRAPPVASMRPRRPWRASAAATTTLPPAARLAAWTREQPRDRGAPRPRARRPARRARPAAPEARARAPSVVGAPHALPGRRTDAIDHQAGLGRARPDDHAVAALVRRDLGANAPSRAGEELLRRLQAPVAALLVASSSTMFAPTDLDQTAVTSSEPSSASCGAIDPLGSASGERRPRSSTLPSDLPGGGVHVPAAPRSSPSRRRSRRRRCRPRRPAQPFRPAARRAGRRQDATILRPAGTRPRSSSPRG